MSHLTSRTAYSRLVDRLNLFPQGATPSELLHKILQMLFTENEAELVALLPIRPFTAAGATTSAAPPDARAPTMKMTGKSGVCQ